MTELPGENSSHPIDKSREEKLDSPSGTQESGKRSNPTARLFGLWFRRIPLEPLERATFYRHTVAASIYGIFHRMMGIGSYVLRKELGGTDFQITLFTSLTMAVFVFSTVGASYLTWKNHRFFMLIYAILGPLSLGTFLIHHGSYFFISVFVWVHFNHALFLPAQSMIFRSNYRREVRGVCYARAQIIRSLVFALTAEAVGRILNWDPGSFPFIFTAGGVIGAFSYLLFFSMPRNRKMESGGRLQIKKARVSFFGDFFRIMARDKFFRRYEIYFFLYGIAFLMTWPLVPMFLDDVLDANYQEAARVFGVIQAVVMMVFIPLFGLLLDRTNAIPVAAIACLCLAFWPLSLAVASSMAMAYVAAFFFGLGMAGVDIAWTLGAQTFASENEIHRYHAIHITLVGLRAMVAPFFGLLVKTWFGFTEAFVIAGGIFILAFLLMLILNRQRNRAINPLKKTGYA